MVLPALKARRETAALQVDARRAWFAGEGSFEAAFPGLVGARLGSEAVVAGRLAALDAAAIARGAERVVTLPDLGAPAREAALAKALQDALDAEDAAAALERRLLVGLQGFHAAHPGLTDTGTAGLRADLDAAWRAADEAAREGPEELRGEAALRAAALDEERILLDRMLADLWRLALIPGATPPSAAPDLARAQGDDPRWAIARLERLRPFVDAEEASRIDAAVAAWEATRPADPPPPAPDAPEASTDAGERARDEAALAAAAAEAERAKAAEERDERIAGVRERAAEAHRRAADSWESVRALAERSAARRAELEAALAKARLQAAGVKSRLGFGQDRVDEAYSALRDLVGTLRAETRAAEDEYASRERAREAVVERTVAERTRILETRWEIAAHGDLVVRTTRDEALSRWEAALDDEVRAAVRGTVAAREHRDGVARLLLDARESRRALRPEISAAEWERDRAQFGTELAAEVELLGPSTQASVRQRARDLRSVPRALLDANVVLGFVRGSLLTILVALVWWLLRGRTGAIAASLVERVALATPSVRRSDLDGVRPPLERLLRASVDWLLGSFLVAPVGATVPELGFVLRTWLFVAAWRVAVSAYEVVFVRHPDTRAGWVLAAESWDLGRRTVRVLASWAVARGFVRYVLFGLLGADVLDGIARVAIDLTGVGLAAFLLHRWEPILRRRLARMDQESPVVVFLATGPPSPALQAPFAVADVVWLLAASVWAAVNQFGGRRERIGQLLNVVTRYRLKGQATRERVRAPAPPELRAAIQSEHPAPGTCVERPQVDGALWDTWTTWQRVRRQGLVALVGDRGAGKRTALDRFGERLEGGDVSLTRRRIERRLTSERDGVAWMCEAWGLPTGADTPEAVVAALLDQEPRVLVVEALEMAFLRTVNGFQALRALLYTANATSHRHFFVFAVHQPAWRYLAQLGSLVAVEVFGTVVAIPRMGEDLLGQMARARLSAAGWRADYRGLVRSSPFGGDPEVELERATGSFFRLLAEASAGNPGIALDLFADCLSPTDEPGVVEVFMADTLEPGVVEGLTSGDLFTLVALRTQDALAVDEIVAVTNMGPAEVKTTVKHLEQRGLVAVHEDRIRVHEAEIAAVTRTLRRRQFLQG